MGCIYMFTNQVTNESYIGKCRGNVKKRYNAHIRGDGNQPLKEAIDEYGIENFTFQILHDGILDEFLADYEETAITKYNTFHNGYNETPHGRAGAYGENHHYFDKSRDEETKHKISESAKSSPLVAEAQRKATEAAVKTTRGKPRPAEVRDKISIGHRKPDYTEMHDYFVSLPSDMHLSEKTRLLREKFPAVKNSTLYFRIRQWTDIKGKKQHPAYPEVHKFFISLPPDMPLPKKRHLLHNEFPNIRKYLLNRWLNEWSGTKTLIRHPDYSEANNLFLSLSSDMLLSEKRRLLYEKFPNVKRNTMNKWTLNWQSELTPKGDHK